MSSGGHTSTKVYLLVFLWLGIFTALTVAASYLHMAPTKAVALALVIATIKATIVGAFFMHLKTEGRVIFTFLALTAAFVVDLMVLISLDAVAHHWTEPGAIPAVPAVHSQQEQDDFAGGKPPAHHGASADSKKKTEHGAAH